MFFALIPNFTFVDNKAMRIIRRVLIFIDFLCNLAILTIYDYILTLILDLCLGNFSPLGGVSYLGMLLMIICAATLTGVTYKKAMPLVPEQEADTQEDA